MSKGIGQSVGNGGVNNRRDVILIQIYLNNFLSESSSEKVIAKDGLIGPNTISAIIWFQKNMVGMNHPDGRVDPNGKTFRYLTMYLDESEQEEIEKNIDSVGTSKEVGVSKERVRSKAGLDGFQVTYNGVAEDKRSVDGYSINVIKLALKESGMAAAVITSTYRTPEEQAGIMLRNAKKSLKGQYRLYGSAGDQVLKVYEDNKSKKESEVVDLMVDKVNELSKKGIRVSKHCVSPEDYRKLNVIDIGVNSTRAAVKKFHKDKFTKALKALVDEGYIERLIDETGKSNSCWHIEIKPNKKSIPEYGKGSILHPIKYINNGEAMIC
ncbi:peptidoglycan-binding protein [Microbulbifer halophilus]|uniref:Peptidoglycan-binding protein n=1 Tax=Microbulbifer halophilus TaxID=453963 RepID=A0ABW5EF03_9GAMM|nr:peptidoglycan-binding protein [Microbulbifer halophilus]MCW8127925.1 peptidoglycan-binding protein [Microbulbifer halophilus]